jgi:putative endonuclease
MKKGFVYILKSLKNDKYYIGSTTDIRKRLRQHESGNVKATRNIQPIKLEFFQEYDSFGLARKIEYRLKSFKRKDFIEKILQDKIIKSGL